MLKRYRRRPLEVLAVRWVVRATPSDDAKAIVDLINADGSRALFVYEFDEGQMRHVPRIRIESGGNTSWASPNDYVCRGPMGYWAMNPHLFETAMEAVEEDPRSIESCA